MEPVRFGFYSAKAAQLFSSWLWETVDGQTVVVTRVTSDEEACNYRWPDKIPVGQVLRPLGIHQSNGGFVHEPQWGLTDG